MKVRCFTEQDKDDIVSDYLSKELTLSDIASIYGVSRRTIVRVLDEREIPSPMPRLQGEAREVLQILAKHDIYVSELEERLNSPFTLANVQTFLNSCTKTELATLFYNSAVAKITDITKPSCATKQQNQTLAS